MINEWMLTVLAKFALIIVAIIILLLIISLIRESLRWKRYKKR